MEFRPLILAIRRRPFLAVALLSVFVAVVSPWGGGLLAEIGAGCAAADLVLPRVLRAIGQGRSGWGERLSVLASGLDGQCWRCGGTPRSFLSYRPQHPVCGACVGAGGSTRSAGRAVGAAHRQRAMARWAAARRRA